MATKIKSYTPNEKKLKFMQGFFKELADQQKEEGADYGIIGFTYRDLEEASAKSKRLDRQLRKPNIVMAMNWLGAQGYVGRLRVGRNYNPSVWNVQKFIEAESIKSIIENSTPFQPEQKGVSTKFEVSVIKETEKPKDNTEVLATLNDTMANMLQYLQALPNEMTAELKNISKDLTYVDHDVVLELTKEKEDLKDEVSRLKEQLERASATPDYSEHYIYRQRNLIIDEVQRILHAPAWSVKQNKEHYQQSVIEKLDNIMSHLNIKQNTLD